VGYQLQLCERVEHLSVLVVKCGKGPADVLRLQASLDQGSHYREPNQVEKRVASPAAATRRGLRRRLRQADLVPILDLPRRDPYDTARAYARETALHTVPRENHRCFLGGEYGGERA